LKLLTPYLIIPITKTGILLREPVSEGQKVGLKIFFMLSALSMTSFFENEVDRPFILMSIVWAISRYRHATLRSPPKGVKAVKFDGDMSCKHQVEFKYQRMKINNIR
jgi:hypothetical protein